MDTVTVEKVRNKEDGEKEDGEKEDGEMEDKDEKNVVNRT